MIRRITLAAAPLLLLAAGAAVAAPPCTQEPRSKWLSESAMKQKIAELGYKDIRVFHQIGSCYEIYGRTAEGKRAEVYFNPVDGSVVKANID